MSTGWNYTANVACAQIIINLLGNEYWLELGQLFGCEGGNYKPTGK